MATRIESKRQIWCAGDGSNPGHYMQTPIQCRTTSGAPPACKRSASHATQLRQSSSLHARLLSEQPPWVVYWRPAAACRATSFGPAPGFTKWPLVRAHKAGRHRATWAKLKLLEPPACFPTTGLLGGGRNIATDEGTHQEKHRHGKRQVEALVLAPRRVVLGVRCPEKKGGVCGDILVDAYLVGARVVHVVLLTSSRQLRGHARVRRRRKLTSDRLQEAATAGSRALKQHALKQGCVARASDRRHPT